MVKKKKSGKDEKIKDFLKKIISAIVPKEEIIDILYKKKNVNEFLISKKLALTINQTRNILYKLSDHGLVKFIRKKDKKKGGWYTYFWTLNIQKSLELLKNQLLMKIKALEEDMKKRKNERFYYSPNANIEYTEEQALEHNFICPETGDVLQLKNNSEIVNQLEIEISKIKILVEELNIELSDIEKKETQLKERKLKAEMKKKEEERRAKRKKLERERKKLRKEKTKKLKKDKVLSKKKIPKGKKKKKLKSQLKIKAKKISKKRKK